MAEELKHAKHEYAPPTSPPLRADLLAARCRFRQPMTNSFVSVPADLGQLNCAALVAGVIAGVLDGASFVSAACDLGFYAMVDVYTRRRFASDPD